MVAPPPALQLYGQPSGDAPAALETSTDLRQPWQAINPFITRPGIFAADGTADRGFFRLRSLATTGANRRVSVGSGGIALDLPAGTYGPSRNPYITPRVPAVPKVVAGNGEPVPTCSWWSSAVWDFGSAGPSGLPLFAWPLGYVPTGNGMTLGLPSVKAISQYEYHWEFVFGAAGERPLAIGPSGMTSPEFSVVRWGDWTVDLLWQQGSTAMNATIGMGLPMAWFTCSGADLEVTPATGSGLQVWRNTGNELGLRIFGVNYLLFAPPGATWSNASPFRPSLSGAVALAVVPDTNSTTLDRFRGCAAPTDSRVAWSYDEASATLTTSFTLYVEPGQKAPPMAIFPHQWLHTNATVTDAYDSPRGRMKLVDGGSFTTTMKFPGLIPHLPPPAADASFSPTVLQGYLDSVAGDTVPSGADTYWAGKAMGKLANLIPIARQFDRHNLADTWLVRLKSSMEDWLDGQAPNLFRYDKQWSTLYGFPAGYETNGYLQDHHFHWGYFLQAAALIAREDPSWAARYGPALELLIRDTANWERSEKTFPFLNSFEPYAGHAWSNGPAAFHAGNNQESSSESINFAAGVFHWGAATGNKAIRDLGIYLYTTEIEAARRYWFNEGGYAFPGGFNWPMVGILWGNGGAYATWFGGHPDFTQYIHGINFLPLTPASLYLGFNPAHLLSNLEPFNASPPASWFDVIVMARAMADPEDAAARLAANSSYAPESGETRAHTYHWVHALRQFGTPVGPLVTANHPTVTILQRGATKTRIFWNPGNGPAAADFSDGQQVSGAAKTLAVHKDPLPQAGKAMLAHYMPWYETPAIRGQWGVHWTGHNNEHNPEVIDANGLPDIWSHFHPLIGLYDSSDPDVLECHLLQMKLAGINGVIVDWYGTYPAADYPAIHEATKAMFEACGKFGMKFAACYEDRSLELLVSWGKISSGEVPAQLAENLNWAAAEWFGAPQYFQFEGRPLLLNFGPIYVKDKDAWSPAVDGYDPRPAFFALHHLWQDAGADGGFSWVHTEPFDGEPGEEVIVQRLTDTHSYRSSDPLKSIPSVYPGFEDVYETSLHNLGRREGRTMRETLKAAMEGPWPVMQLVTWNDYGEGTVIEPTHEDGYAALEAVQDARRKELGDAFTFTADDLRLPARLYALRKRNKGKTDDSALELVSALLSAGDCKSAKDSLDRLGHPSSTDR
jgi:endoglucanase Acf2